uniref:Transposase n=1 Tax=Nephromyces sp. MMRI TaxID=2496275 RepID=A0A3Q8UBR0_9APIC|nr:transposase [Nephromyces sp. MMRI]
MADYLTQNCGISLRKNDGTIVQTSTVSAEIIGFYFSAEWCPPCKKFTPMLANIYQSAKSMNKSFEIVFVSHDRSVAQFENYHRTMPWLALEYNNPNRMSLIGKHQINAVPTLIIMTRTGQVISKDRNTILNPNFVSNLPTHTHTLTHTNFTKK